MTSPYKQWLKKMAELEDKSPSVCAGDFGNDDVSDEMVEMFEDGFTCGLTQMREMLARFVEQGGHPEVAQSMRLNWRPSWGEDPGPPSDVNADLVVDRFLEHARTLMSRNQK